MWIDNVYAGTARIAVAANFTDAMQKLAPAFEQDTGYQLKISYGSTGKLYSQIVHGAPFDIFMAADADRPARAEREGHAVSGSRWTYARGQLVLWSASPGLFEDGAEYLKSASISRVAIANPKTAPYGMAAQQTMQQLGVWARLERSVIRGDSISQTFQFVATGNASVGFVSASQLHAWPRQGSYWPVPSHLHQPIDQQVVLLNKGANNPAANAFIEFLRSTKTQTLLSTLGYGVGQ